MVHGIESVGEVVTGGMIARAVEPGAGETAVEGSQCLNCATPLVGKHCHACGQAGHVHRTLGAFGHDIAHSVLHFDGKIWRTLPLLAWRPGELTRRYVEGERARFVSPMALFLFSVFLMFGVFSATGGPFDVSSAEEARAEVVRELSESADLSKTRIRTLEQEKLAAIKRGKPNSAIDRTIGLVRVQQQQADENSRRAAAGEPVEGAMPGISNDRVNFRTGIPFVDAGLDKANENPSLLLYKLQTNAYKFSWALIPISVPFLWLLFLHRRRYWQYRAYDHIVFVTYSIAFMSLGLIVLSLLRPLELGADLIGLAIGLVPPIHMYRQLRGAYRLSRWSAGWRAFVLLIFAFIAALLFLLLLLTLGVLG
ncbi:MAG: DUF3667 domain-containing protein [Sphingosinicella sp.]|nr:DUF3667 domain-containing protein [Sphingosinicella sp.]